MSPYAVIFDMDGVICHTNPYHADAFRLFFDRKNIPYTDQEFREHMYGRHNSYIMRYFMKRQIEGEELLALEDEKEALFREIYASRVVEIDGYLGFLASLKASHFKTGVATSAPYANLKLIMDQLEIEPNMESILSSENVSKHKPDPEVYLLSAHNLGIPPSNCLVFEDSFSGVTAARNAGMKVVGVLSSHTIQELPPCNFYVRDYMEITVDAVQEIMVGA